MKATIIATTLALGAYAAEEEGAVTTPAPIATAPRIVGGTYRPYAGRPRYAAYGAPRYGAVGVVGRPAGVVGRPVASAVVGAVAEAVPEQNEALEWDSDLQEARIEYGDAINEFKELKSGEPGAIDTGLATEVYEVAEELSDAAAVPGAIEEEAAARSAYQANRTPETLKAYKVAHYANAGTQLDVVGRFGHRYFDNKAGGVRVAGVLSKKADYDEAAAKGDDPRDTRDEQADYYRVFSAFTRGADSKLTKTLEKNYRFIEADDDTHDYTESKKALMEARAAFQANPTDHEAREALEAAMLEARKEQWNMMHRFSDMLSSPGSLFSRLAMVMKYRSALAFETYEAFGNAESLQIQQPARIQRPMYGARPVYGGSYGGLVRGSRIYG